MEAGLYVVATPIGNLEDITLRALAILRAADLIAAEDTRHSARLLQRYDVAVPVVAYHDHSDPRAQNRITACLEAGGTVALISDAGTPLISDPGYRLVRSAQESGFRVVPIPGACAAITALCASGLPTDRFHFEGFLPAKSLARSQRLEQLSEAGATLVFYEAPHRVLDTLEAMATAFGPAREAVLARELTKTFETLRRGSLEELARLVAEDANQRRGEIVILVSGGDRTGVEITPEIGKLLRRLAEELPAKRAAAVVAEHTGLRKNQLYQYLLSQRSDAATDEG